MDEIRTPICSHTVGKYLLKVKDKGKRKISMDIVLVYFLLNLNKYLSTRQSHGDLHSIC